MGTSQTMNDPRDPRPVDDPRDPRPANDPRDPRPADALARADALRARLRDALSDAQRALASAEDTNRDLHRELEQMTTSAARRLLVGARQGATRAANVVRHPLWTAGTVARGLAVETRTGHGAPGHRSPGTARVPAAPVGAVAPMVRGTGRVRRDSLDWPRQPAAPGARGHAVSPAGRAGVPGQGPRRCLVRPATARSRRRYGRSAHRGSNFTFDVRVPAMKLAD